MSAAPLLLFSHSIAKPFFFVKQKIITFLSRFLRIFLTLLYYLYIHILILQILVNGTFPNFVAILLGTCRFALLRYSLPFSHRFYSLLPSSSWLFAIPLPNIRAPIRHGAISVSVWYKNQPPFRFLINTSLKRKISMHKFYYRFGSLLTIFFRRIYKTAYIFLDIVFGEWYI